MGYNTVMVILNDNVDMGKNDPELGRKIYEQVLQYGRKHYPELGYTGDVYASGKRCTASYGQIISQEHADYDQIVVVGGNTGLRLQELQNPDRIMWQIEAFLKRFGYKVIKDNKKKAGG